jgi:ABC-type bacteriocin/lantibiotic exporter with double-glycine peptidase domain
MKKSATLDHPPVMARRFGALLFASWLLSVGCGQGRVGVTQLVRAEADSAWTIVRGVPFVPQRVERDCGAAVLAMALGKGGRPVRVEDLTSALPSGREGGTSAVALRDVARARGFEAQLFAGTLEDLETEIERGHPVVVGLAKGVNDERLAHYELVIGLRRDETEVMTMDPASGPHQSTLTTFLAEWAGASWAALVVWREDRALVRNTSAKRLSYGESSLF